MDVLVSRFFIKKEDGTVEAFTPHIPLFSLRCESWVRTSSHHPKADAGGLVETIPQPKAGHRGAPQPRNPAQPAFANPAYTGEIKFQWSPRLSAGSNQPHISGMLLAP